MSVGRELRQLYDTAIYESVRGTEQWMQVCKLTGQWREQSCLTACLP